MKLLGIHLSPFVRKVAVALAIKGLEYQHEIIIPRQLPPDFLALSPMGKIPVLQDGDFILPDSTVICEYLEEKYPQPPMLPRGTEARAQARFLEEYADTRLLEVTSPLFLEGFARPRFFGQESDLAHFAQVRDELLPPVLDYLETRIPSDRFIFGALGIADISVVSHLLNAAYGGYKVDAGRWPATAALVLRVKSMPVVAAVLAREKTALNSLPVG